VRAAAHDSRIRLERAHVYAYMTAVVVHMSVLGEAALLLRSCGLWGFVAVVHRDLVTSVYLVGGQRGLGGLDGVWRCLILDCVGGHVRIAPHEPAAAPTPSMC
jgi:hypothetical protein